MASTPSPFQLKKTYNFSTLAPGVLPLNYKNALMVAELSYEVALSAMGMTTARYRQIFPALPPGTPDTPELARYFMFKTQSGQTEILCEQWINLSTIQEVTGINFSIVFEQADITTPEEVRSLLAAAGYTNFVIKT